MPKYCNKITQYANIIFRIYTINGDSSLDIMKGNVLCVYVYFLKLTQGNHQNPNGNSKQSQFPQERVQQTVEITLDNSNVRLGF